MGPLGELSKSLNMGFYFQAQFHSIRRKESTCLLWICAFGIYSCVHNQKHVQASRNSTYSYTDELENKQIKRLSGKLACSLKGAVIITSHVTPNALDCTMMRFLFPGSLHFSANLTRHQRGGGVAAWRIMSTFLFSYWQAGFSESELFSEEGVFRASTCNI